VKRVHGDYFSVMGLSVRRLVALRAEVGIDYDFARGLSVRD
jgi:predicted house-cleaning NTP pyrophosphatase (Maf/HAM1 superfamily)